MGSYRISRLALVALAVTALGACARDVTSPSGAKTAPRFAAAAANSRYIVLFKGNGVPVDFGARVQALGGTVTYSHSGAGLALVNGLADATAGTLAAGKDVQDVAPDFDIALDQPAGGRTMATDVVTVEHVDNPTGASRYNFQWNMRLIGANTAWAAGKLGSSDVTVAILDTGLDYDARDLNGLVDLSRSTSFVPSDNDITRTYFPSRDSSDDYNGHGTNVATQVSSKAWALAGVTSKTTLMSVKVLGGNGHSSGGSVLAGVLWAADHGADVANMSLGGGFAKAGLGRYVAQVNRVFDYAKRKGMLIVVAAGNQSADLDRNGNELTTYCNATHVICVSSVGPAVGSDVGTLAADAVSYFSNFGRSAIDVAAPGGNGKIVDGNLVSSNWVWGAGVASWVWSYCAKYSLAFDDDGNPLGFIGCQSGGYLNGYIGTSQATPHVSGLAALLVAEIGHNKPAQIKAAIMKSADDLGQPGTDPYYGAGRINVARALGL